MTDTTTPALGDQARDRVTGFQGIVTGECTYLTGCKQLLLAPTVGEDGEFRDSQWFDIDRCEVVTAEALALEVTTPGPDKPAPRR